MADIFAGLTFGFAIIGVVTVLYLIISFVRELFL